MANTPGTWNFSDLHTADPAASIAFYVRVFGWVFDDLGFATMIRQPGFGDHGRDVRPRDPRATVRRFGATRFRRCLRLAGYAAARKATALACDIHGRRSRRFRRSR